MPTKIRSMLLVSAALVGVFLPAQAGAIPVFKLADNAQLDSLVNKLQATTHDIGDVAETVDNRDGVCLYGMTQNAQSVLMYLVFARGLLILAAEMRDKTDEYYVLADLSSTLRAISKVLPDFRQIINKAMGACSRSAIVSVKGQAVLNIYYEIEQRIAPIQKVLDNVERGVPAKSANLFFWGEKK